MALLLLTSLLREPPLLARPRSGWASGTRPTCLPCWASVQETSCSHTSWSRQAALGGVFVGVQGPVGRLSRGLRDAGATVPGHPQCHSPVPRAARQVHKQQVRAAQEAAGERGGSTGRGQARLLSAAHALAGAAGRLRTAARPASVTRLLAVSWGGRPDWPHASRHPPG